jgi:hypothetical protein
MDLVLSREINPGCVFEIELLLDDLVEDCDAMDERRAIKTSLRVRVSTRCGSGRHEHCNSHLGKEVR